MQYPATEYLKTAGYGDGVRHRLAMLPVAGAAAGAGALGLHGYNKGWFDKVDDYAADAWGGAKDMASKAVTGIGNAATHAADSAGHLWKDITTSRPPIEAPGDLG